MILAQDQHVDVSVITDGLADGELDREPAGDLPRAGQCREDRGGLRGLGRVPGAERGNDGCRHLTLLEYSCAGRAYTVRLLLR
jgi:hypothetical protein